MMKVKDDYITEIRFLHQTKEFKNIFFHKFKLKEQGVWRTYWYLDSVDIERLTKPSKLDRRLYKL